MEKELENIKDKGGNGFIAENKIYGKKIHLLRCPDCHRDNDYVLYQAVNVLGVVMIAVYLNN